MKCKKISLKEAIKFHGHLGPYLVLGLLAGEVALAKLNCKKYFGLDVKVSGASEKPKSCLIDGLQMSTGATYGKGNIKKVTGKKIRIEIINFLNKKKITLLLKNKIFEILNKTKKHRDCEKLAKKLYKTKQLELFDLISKS